MSGAPFSNGIDESCKTLNFGQGQFRRRRRPPSPHSTELFGRTCGGAQIPHQPKWHRADAAVCVRPRLSQVMANALPEFGSGETFLLREVEPLFDFLGNGKSQGNFAVVTPGQCVMASRHWDSPANQLRIPQCAGIESGDRGALRDLTTLGGALMRENVAEPGSESLPRSVGGLSKLSETPDEFVPALPVEIGCHG